MYPLLMLFLLIASPSSAITLSSLDYEDVATNACDPIESLDPEKRREVLRSERPLTQSGRKENLDRIEGYCRDRGGSKSFCKLARAISLRETTGRSSVRHWRKGDRLQALNQYVRMAPQYGWQAEWSGPKMTCVKQRGENGKWKTKTTSSGKKVWARKCTVHPENLVMTKIRDDANPHYEDPLRWSSGLGAFSTPPAVSMLRIDPMGPPELLCVPEVSTENFMAWTYTTVKTYGLHIWLHVNSIFSGAIVDNGPQPREQKDRNFCRRLRDQGVNCQSEIKLGRYKPDADFKRTIALR